MKKLILLFSILLISLTVYSSNRVDSLALELENYAKQDTVRINMIYEYSRASNLNWTDTNKVLMDEAFLLSKKLNYKAGIAEGHFLIGWYYVFQSENELAIENYLKAIKRFKELDNTSKLLRAYSNLSNVYNSTNDFEKAFKSAIEQAKSEIDAITSNLEVPNFSNTIEALDYSGEDLDRISSIFFNLNSAETNDNLQKIAQMVSPMLAEFSNDVTLNEDLFNRVKTVYNNRESLNLTPEQRTLLSKKYRGFARNGANLNASEKDQLRTIDKELSQLKLKFGENVLADTNNYNLHLTKEHQLKGLPDGAKEAAKQLAKEQGKEGWIITLDYPSYIPFMTYAEDRKLREELAKAFGSKGFLNNEHN
ncbi:MAG: hypothetical protein HRT73_06190, partial [Flavobacteriales bacterium]|nr:hypothetical protein [Flavobacteriales bacterium]